MTERLTEQLESLRRGEQLELDLEQIEALIAWLSGSSRRKNAQHVKPDHDPVLVLLVLQQLDRSLFKDYRLNVEAAGLGPEQPMSLRRIRFRRLAGAFHPDRFPDLADWLTVRSQAVHHAYARFKQNPDSLLDYDRPENNTAAAAARAQTPAATIRYPQARNRSFFKTGLIQLRARFGHDRRLAHKLIAGLALIAALPVANLYLAPDIPQLNQVSTVAADQNNRAITSHAETADEASAGGITVAQSETPIATSVGNDSTESTAQNEPTAATFEPVPVSNDTAAVIEQSVFGRSVDEQMAALNISAQNGASIEESKPADVLVSSPTETEPAIMESIVKSIVEQHAARPLITASAIGPPADPGVVIEQPTSAANADSTEAKPSKVQGNDLAMSETPEQGELVLGPLRHHPVGRLLARYQSHVQSGNLAALMALFSSASPRQGHRNGSDAVADYYRTLFDRSSQRTVDLRVLRMQRDGEGWQVEMELDFSITAADRIEEIVNSRTRFHIQPDRGRLKIAAIEY